MSFPHKTANKNKSVILIVDGKFTRVGSYTSGFGYDLAGSPTSFKGASRIFNVKSQWTGGTGLGSFIYDGNGAFHIKRTAA